MKNITYCATVNIILSQMNVNRYQFCPVENYFFNWSNSYKHFLFNQCVCEYVCLL